MNDDTLSHAISMLEGSIEIVKRQCDDRTAIQSDKFQRLMKAAKDLAMYITASAKKSE